MNREERRMVLPNYKQWAESLYFMLTNTDKTTAVAELAYALKDAEQVGRTLTTGYDPKQVKEII